MPVALSQAQAPPLSGHLSSLHPEVSRDLRVVTTKHQAGSDLRLLSLDYVNLNAYSERCMP